MAWTYKRAIKVIPGIHLNLSKGNVNTIIDIPATGGRQYGHRPLPQDYFNTQHQGQDNIFSADVQQITSQDMAGVKEAITAAHQQREDLRKDLIQVKASLASAGLKLSASYILLYGLLVKSIPARIKADIKAQKEAIRQIEQQIEASCVTLEVTFEPELERKYAQVVAGFKQLCTSIKIWDVTSEHHQDRVSTRSAASAVVSKREVRFGMRSLPHICCELDTLWMKNANGADLYFYPGFIVMYKHSKDFALIGLHEMIVHHRPVRFVESGTVPADTKVIDHTWARVNKNGQPDKRFKDNYQIPIVKYGEIGLNTATGLQEVYMFSNYEYSEAFVRALADYRDMIV
jgi:hypothetical protein